LRTRISQNFKMVQGGMKCIKYLLFLFNLVFVIIGIVLIAVGVSVRLGFKPYYDLVDTSEFSTPPNLFIAVGVIVFFIAFLGCCGAVKENNCMMMTYSVLVGLLLVVELGAAFAAFALQDDVEGLLFKGLNETQHHYSLNTTDQRHIDETKSWDLMQHTLKCCGTHNFTDWGTIISSQNKTFEIPQSCCIEDAIDCSLKAHVNVTSKWDEAAKVIHVGGCLDKAVNDIAIKTLGIVGICLAVVELLGVICACFLARSIRYSYETV